MQLWQTVKKRKKQGQAQKYETAEHLLDSAFKYFEWADNTPITEKKGTHHQGTPLTLETPKIRPYTLAGLRLFLDISEPTWLSYRKSKDAEFRAAVETVDTIIRQQKFEGAAAEIFNANIIARDLGLADKSEVSGENGGPVKHEWNIQPVKFIRESD